MARRRHRGGLVVVLGALAWALGGVPHAAAEQITAFPEEYQDKVIAHSPAYPGDTGVQAYTTDGGHGMMLGSATGYEWSGSLRFNLSSIFPSYRVVSATLVLTPDTGSFQLGHVDISGVGVNYPEGSGGDPFVPLGSVGVDPGGPETISLSITPFVRSLENRGKQEALIHLDGYGAPGHGPVVIEGHLNGPGHGPRLILQTEAVPEPGSLTLVGLGAAGLLGFGAVRRRRTRTRRGGADDESAG